MSYPVNFKLSEAYDNGLFCLARWVLIKGVSRTMRSFGSCER